MKKSILAIVVTFLLTFQSQAQCDTTYLSSTMNITMDQIMSGVYIIDGDFIVDQGVTVYVQSFSFGDCGTLEIQADNIKIHGTINGDYAGYSGGTGGQPGSQVNSITGDAGSLTSCSNKDNPGQVEVEGGLPGTDGNGPGAGIAGLQGTTGSGPKQICETTDDTYGMFGSAGGAGGGGGGAYGADAAVGSIGGNGTAVHSSSGVDVSGSYPVVGGQGGQGGLGGAVYGTEDQWDIDLGSGGAGAGGGGRSYDQGLAGGAGGAGGGLVKLIANDSLVVTGFISVNGDDGEAGGNGGSGGASSKCCSDGCNDCGEANFSSGAGAGSGGGGGSGGGIYLETKDAARVTGILESKGGQGGLGGNMGSGVTCTYSATFCGSQDIETGDGLAGNTGGEGSGGRIKIFVPDCDRALISTTHDVTGGNGNTTIEGTYAEVCGYLQQEENQLPTFQIYPNPAYNQINIRLFESFQTLNLTIIDMSGRVVMQNVNYNMQPIDVSQFTSGVYFIQLNVDGHTTTEKVVIK